MPPIKIDYVKSFSSEDPVHIANNVLKNDSKKWKCKTAGEQTAVIVLQLEKATEITGLDIGNEHSAFIEVLVSRSGAGDDFKGLLVASSFMTPSEAKHSQNVNQVRMFTKEHLLKPQCDEKWDRVKFVCTQPFNRYVQYGLSFIVLHTKEDKAGGTAQSNIGRFALRPASPDVITVGSLFAKLQETKKEEPKKEDKLSGAAAIREAASATSLARYGSPKCKPQLKTTDSTPKQSRAKDQHSEDGEQLPQKDRNRDDLYYTADDDKVYESIDKIIKQRQAELRAKMKKEEDEANKKKKIKEEYEAKWKKEEDEARKKKKERDEAKKKKKEEDEAKKKKKEEEEAKKNIWGLPKAKKKTPEDESKKDLKRKLKDDARREETRKKKKVVVTKPYEKLLEGVTIVVSGIQNPDRAALRSMALAMGAKYKPDWDSACTHLICAFANTPKFNQVKGKGKIVTKTWLEECHKQRKRLPWRRFALDKNDKDKDESEEEICETVAEPEARNDSPEPMETDFSDQEADFCDHMDEGSDTEERVARILAAKASSAEKPSPASDNSVYSVDTDEEELPERTWVPDVEELAGFFDGKTFYVDHSLEDEEYDRVLQYIVAHRGKLARDPAERVDLIVATRESSEEYKEINDEVTCVSSDWIWICHNRKELVDIDDYLY